MSDMTTIKMPDDKLLALLMERVEYWNDGRHDYVYELYKEAYRYFIDDGVFDGAEFDVEYIVDNHHFSWCAYETEEEFKHDYSYRSKEELEDMILAKLPSGAVLVDGDRR